MNMRWYIVHAYSNFEKKVAESIREQASQRGLTDQFELVSELVDAINHPVPEGATETTVLGPFFVQAAPEKDSGADISGPMEGDPMLVTGSVSTFRIGPPASHHGPEKVPQRRGLGAYHLLVRPGPDGIGEGPGLRHDAEPLDVV